MGLDMYLNRTTHLSRTNYFDQPTVGNHVIERTVSQQEEHDMGGAVIDVIGVTPYEGDLAFVEVTTTIMYWRKANAIHGWFVDTVQDGVDDCDEYDVSLDQLIELNNLVGMVRADRKPELLTPREGFFFGDAKVDDWYWDELERTTTALTAIIDRHPDVLRGNYEYHSSW